MLMRLHYRSYYIRRYLPVMLLALVGCCLKLPNDRLIGFGSGLSISRVEYMLCLKKAPTFKLSVTLSNSNRFSKFLHCCKAHEICYKTHTTNKW